MTKKKWMKCLAMMMGLLILLAENSDGKIVGFSHFKYELDYGDEVLYVYEIQVDSKFQRKGLGRFMMQVLEMLGNVEIKT